MNKITILALGATLAAPAAFAGGLSQPVPEPVVAAPAPIIAPAVDGNWGGGYVGVQLGYGKVKADSVDVDASGAIGGIHGGYRWDLGKAVLGAELDYNASNIDSSDPDAKLKNLTRLKLQAGYDLGRTLVYVSAGPAHAKADIAGDSYSDNGWFAGVGLDYQLSDQWTVGGEALYNKFDNFDKSGIDVDGTTVQLKAAYHF
ncbi:MAG: porin family protein [Paracoccaceae bacterium]